MSRRRAAALAAAAASAAIPALAAAAVDAAPLPDGTKRLPASTDECAVWRREQSFADTVARHDAAAFASHLHRGATFDAGAATADRGLPAVVDAWAAIVRGDELALRWRAGIVHIGEGEPNVALSHGPYVLQTMKDGAAVFRVGSFQTVWVRSGATAPWLVLFDASASTPIAVADRAAADRWVAGQPMADCAAR